MLTHRISTVGSGDRSRFCTVVGFPFGMGNSSVRDKRGARSGPLVSRRKTNSGIENLDVQRGLGRVGAGDPLISLSSKQSLRPVSRTTSNHIEYTSQLYVPRFPNVHNCLTTWTGIGVSTRKTQFGREEVSIGDKTKKWYPIKTDKNLKYTHLSVS